MKTLFPLLITVVFLAVVSTKNPNLFYPNNPNKIVKFDNQYWIQWKDEKTGKLHNVSLGFDVRPQLPRTKDAEPFYSFYRK